MRVGLAASIFCHVAILGFGFIALPDAQPMAPEPIEALPVDLVDVADLTDLLAGDKRAEELPEEPQPVPDVQADAPSAEPAEEPAEQPVEAARAPAARPEPPAPEPEPVPEPEEVAALPEPEPEPLPPEPEPAPLVEQEPTPPAEARLPRARPEPPRQVVQPEPEPEPELEPDREAAEEAERLLAQPAPDEAEREFDPDDITALLNKQDPAGGGAPQPVEAPQTLGSIDGNMDAAMTQSMIAALRARLAQCWAPPVGVREAGNLVVTVRISLLPDGSLATQPVPMSIGLASDPLAHVATEAAIRAVAQCAPFGPDILRPENYALWREIDFVFDPQMMLGG